jgi:hypothetical protein
MRCPTKEEIVCVLISILVIYFGIKFFYGCATDKTHCYDSKINWTKVCAHGSCEFTLFQNVCEGAAKFYDNTCDCSNPDFDKEECDLIGKPQSIT